jgi:hypothetical protein
LTISSTPVGSSSPRAEAVDDLVLVGLLVLDAVLELVDLQRAPRRASPYRVLLRGSLQSILDAAQLVVGRVSSSCDGVPQVVDDLGAEWP